MAYRFNGTTDEIRFAIGPLGGITLGAFTLAMFLKRNAGGSGDVYLPTITNAGVSAINWHSRLLSLVTPFIGSVSGSGQAPSSCNLSSTSLWYLLAITWSGSGNARFHLHDGTSWTHANSPVVGPMTSQALAGTDRIYVPVPASFGGIGALADIVCIGIKKADSADATVQTLSRTAFSAWLSYGFDWLIGFDSSLVSGGLLQDQASPGTGDEVARAGTSAVSDPAGWSFATTVTPVADFTGTPLSGTAPLSVTFTDTSTNTPTSWAWDFGDGGTSTSQNPTHSYSSPGTYTVVLVATNAAGSNTKTRTSYVVVGGAPTADFTGTPLSGSASLSVAFTDTSTGSPTSWAWTFGDGGTSTSQNPSHSYTSSGVYTVVLVATNTAGSNTKTRTGYVTVSETIAYATGGGIDIY